MEKADFKEVLDLLGDQSKDFLASVSEPSEDVIFFFALGEKVYCLISLYRLAIFDSESRAPALQLVMEEIDFPEVPRGKRGLVEFHLQYKGAIASVKVPAEYKVFFSAALEFSIDNALPYSGSTVFGDKAVEDSEPSVIQEKSVLEKYLQQPVNEKENKVFMAMLPAFESAVEFSEIGDWQNEVLKLQEALATANALAFFRGESWFQDVREKLIRAGLLFRGAEFVAQIVAENGLELINRKQKLLASRAADTLSVISIWSDRIVAGDQVVAIDEFTSASVFVDGLDQITQRPTLTRMAFLSPLPGSALIAGLALQKKNRNDLRDVLFTVSSADWQFSCSISPSAIQFAKSAAERVNAIAAKLERGTSRGSKIAASQNSLADEISKLNSLLKQGVLTQDEFDGLKAKLIADA